MSIGRKKLAGVAARSSVTVWAQSYSDLEPNAFREASLTVCFETLVSLYEERNIESCAGRFAHCVCLLQCQSFACVSHRLTDK